MQKTNITPQDGFHYFFGYYDLQPFSTDGSMHLTHRVAFMDRMQTAADPCEIGYISIADHTFHHLADTRAWCFQQGAFLQWLDRDESVIFNDFDGERYVARVVDLRGRETGRFDHPIATLCREKNVALSMNFARVYDFRPGYGYCNIPDAGRDANAPADDGIFLTDLKSGKRSLLLSYAEMRERLADPPYTDCKLVVNHINLDPTGTRYVILLRNFAAGNAGWQTMLAVGDLAGNIRALSPFTYNSHYHLRDDKTLMIYTDEEINGKRVGGVYFYDLDSGRRERLQSPFSDHGDIHCRYSHDLRFAIGDSYPNQNSERVIYYYNFESKNTGELCRAYSMKADPVDYRCDLHVRLHTDDRTMSYDSTENRRREIMLARLTDADIA